MRKCVFVLVLMFIILLSSCHLFSKNDSVKSEVASSPSNESSPSSEKESPATEIGSTVETPRPSIFPDPSPSAIPSDDGLKSSSDDIDYSDSSPVSMDFNSDGKEETLTIKMTHDFEYEDDGMTNNPTQVKMSIGDSEVTYESTWNDGIVVRISDFNVDDPYLDILVEDHGTDIATSFGIYRYDGVQLAQYLGFHVEFVSFNYDTKGKIYYYTYIEDGDDLRSVYVTLDYVSKKETYIDVDNPY